MRSIKLQKRTEATILGSFVEGGVSDKEITFLCRGLHAMHDDVLTKVKGIN